MDSDAAKTSQFFSTVLEFLFGCLIYLMETEFVSLI